MSSPEYSLDDIRGHPDFPFADWQENDLSFLMLELFWAETVRAILGEEMPNYQPLFDTQRDGNPILTITNTATQRGLRLVLFENEDGKPEYPEATGPGAHYALYPYLNVGRFPDGETEVSELVMLVRFHDDYQPFMETILRRHCVEYAPADEVEELIAAYEKELSMADPEADSEQS